MPGLVISLNKIPTSGKILLLCVSQINRLNVYERSNFTCFITNENFSSLTTISNASFNFWRLQANKLMSTTSQERTPCYLLRSLCPERIPKTLVFWLRGYTKTRRYSKPGATQNTLSQPYLKKSRLREVGAEYTPGSSRTPRHSILGGPFNIHKPFKWASQFGKPFNLVSHSIVSHSIWYCLFWHNTPSIVGNLAKLHH